MAMALSRNNWVRTTFALITALVIGVIIVVSTLRENMAIRSPLSRTNAILALAVADKPERLAAQGQRLAVADPMQAAAFVMLGLDQLRRNPKAYDETARLMRFATSRLPTLAPPQVWLAADYARRGDYNRSLQLFDRVLTLSSDQSEKLLPVLSLLAKHPASRNAVIQRLKAYPVWRTNLLIQAIAAKALPCPVIEQLLSGPVPNRYATQLRIERQSYLIWLARNNASLDAHALYRRYAGLSSTNPVYDPDFRLPDTFLPYGWTRADLDEDYAQRVERLGKGWMMRLHSSGKRETTLIEQTVALLPGVWRIEMRGRDGGLALPATWKLALRCPGKENDIGSIGLARLKLDEMVIAMRVSVPDDCPLQRLVIEAKPDENGESEIEVFSVKAVRQ